jgi:hypothetical protein
MRQYDDPVEVRRGEAEDPDQFLWRGRLWKVRTVVAHWVETGPWWQGTQDGAATDLFDLSFDWTDGRWQLVGCQD